MAKPIHKILKIMHENYGVFFEPADQKIAARLSISLVKNGFTKIPADYLDFLSESDGLSFNGLELYGLTSHERDNGAFFHQSLDDVQELRLGNPLLKNKIILGTAPEILIAYNGIERKYEILNRCDYAVLLKLPRFFDVLFYFVPEK